MASKRHSWVGFLLSLLVHSALAAAIFYSVKHDSANSQAAEAQTAISMEMMMGTIIEDPAPQPPVEPEPAPKEEVAKEDVADPTIKPEPVKVKKDIVVEKKKEKPKPAPKEKPKEKKEKPKPVAKVKPMQSDKVKSDREVASQAKVNAVNAGNAHVTTPRPNMAGSGASADELNAYRSALRREIERHKRYPQRAKMMRKQGVVTISFTINGDGSLSGARVAKSSGAEDLDNAALNAVQSARSIGPKPNGMGSAISVPISFKIH